ncbi:MAG: fibronectin type III domain-containing protein [Bacteroidetes bacterium]|nr:fibronectin type III domain-containing protein [Bacteroidota bacterium]
MKTQSTRSRKLKRGPNHHRVNRFRNQRRPLLFVTHPLFILVTLTYNFRALTTAEKVLARLRLHILMLTGNVHFPIVSPSLAALQAKADQLEGLIDSAKSGDHLIILKRNGVMKEAIELIRLLGYDIQKKSDGNAEKIISAGFTIRKERNSSALCAKVLIKKVRALLSAKIHLEWERVNDYTVYVIEVSTTREGGEWYLAAHSDNHSINITGYKQSGEFIFLKPQRRYYFRMYAWNFLGDGDYSETVNMICID